ncbi:hypothetical protein PHLGIDRAFT_15171, partial [Phlebiopsis gigantea 11061_1 CR5-6]
MTSPGQRSLAQDYDSETAEYATQSRSKKVSLWETFSTVKINPKNGKCTTLPILQLDNAYSVNFHLYETFRNHGSPVRLQKHRSWLGFWVAFLSWFAFSPLVPQAVKNDLKLTQQQIGGSFYASVVWKFQHRFSMFDPSRFGPRKVMAGLLIIGAVPSGLAGTVSSAQGLYVIRFFIGILGGTFVPCQAWTTTFYDTPVVGRANALVAGWGNSGGGFTFIIMVALYDRLRGDGMSLHSAWRGAVCTFMTISANSYFKFIAAFAIVPVPVLLFVACATLIFGTDHPNGKWADRHKRPFLQSGVPRDQEGILINSSDGADGIPEKLKDAQSEGLPQVDVKEAIPSGSVSRETASFDHDAKALSWKLASDIILSPLTWLPALAYLASFGYELAIDANLSNVIFGNYAKTKHFDQTKSGYIASIFGLLNVVTRPLGGYMGDLAHRWYGVQGKKYLVLVLGALQGAMSLAWGLYLDRSDASLAVVVVLMVIVAVVDEMANGANFSLVPHCNPLSNGIMTGIVGAMGNLGGVWFALVFRFQPMPFGKALWISVKSKPWQVPGRQVGGGLGGYGRACRRVNALPV